MILTIYSHILSESIFLGLCDQISLILTYKIEFSVYMMVTFLWIHMMKFQKSAIFIEQWCWIIMLKNLSSVSATWKVSIWSQFFSSLLVRVETGSLSSFSASPSSFQTPYAPSAKSRHNNVKFLVKKLLNFKSKIR